ncbi:MAG: PEP-CTERM sorting domain-containing protein [Pirellulaceae bacterium]|nr:PEP-CTERM sorting domain-containing protein [Pirellulaceae bacterium]
MTRYFLVLVLALGAVICESPCLKAGTITTGVTLIYDENNDGSLSTDNLNPTVLLSGGFLPIGISRLCGNVELSASRGNVDVFSFNVAPSTFLTEIRISDYISADQIAVMAISKNSIFPISREVFNDPFDPVLLNDVLGVAQFGTGWGWTTGTGARDLLQGTDPGFLTNANLIGGRANGFQPFETYGPNDKFNQLGPGTYTVYVQQQGDNTDYTMDFTVTAVPEPSSLALLGLVAGFVVRRRSRR